MIRKMLIILAVGAIILQFFRGEEPEVAEVTENDLILSEAVNDDVALLLKSACYDCHSMQTVYPWYSYITPASWFVFDHIRDGRDELNFSEWANYEKRRKIRKLKEITEEVEEKHMPLDSYISMHGEANLSQAQRETIINWAEELGQATLLRE